jgi:hypothetical protein
VVFVLSYLDDYKARMNSKGGTKVNSQVNSTKSFLTKYFKDSPSYQEVYINDSTTLTGVHIVDDSKEREQKLVISLTDPLQTGQIVKWNNIYWLILIVDEFVTHWRGTIKKCESTLKWLDSQGDIKETPFTLKYSPASTYILEQDRIMILSKERRTILVQSNDDTQQIKRGQRFIFDDRAWKVIGYNGLTEGILELTLEEDEINSATDNISLRIADYIPPSTPPSTGLAITINGDPDIRITQSKTWTAILTNDGVQITMQPATWSVVDLNDNPSTLVNIVNQSSESVTLKANSSTTGYVKLKCVLNDSSASAEKQIQIKSLI